MRKNAEILPSSQLESRILLIRGRRVMLDSDLSEVYGTTTKALNQAVKRNGKRFPGDFMSRLTAREKQEVVTNRDHLRRLRFSSVLPYAFTEHGAVMAANVLNRPTAIHASIGIVRAFIRLREVLSTHKHLASKLAELENRIEGHDQEITALFRAIRQLMAPSEKPHKRIGFRA